MSDTWPIGGGDGSGGVGGAPSPAASAGIATGTPVHANADRDRGVTHSVSVAPSRRMRAITGEVDALLDGLEEGSRSSAALLASEPIAQVCRREPGFDPEPVGLTVRLRELLGLLNNGVARVVVDLDAVEFMDSSGIHALRRAAQPRRGSGHRVRIINPVGPVGRLLALTRGESVLPIVDR